LLTKVIDHLKFEDSRCFCSHQQQEQRINPVPDQCSRAQEHPLGAHPEQGQINQLSQVSPAEVDQVDPGSAHLLGLEQQDLHRLPLLDQEHGQSQDRDPEETRVDQHPPEPPEIDLSRFLHPRESQTGQTSGPQQHGHLQPAQTHRLGRGRNDTSAAGLQAESGPAGLGQVHLPQGTVGPTQGHLPAQHKFTQVQGEQSPGGGLRPGINQGIRIADEHPQECVQHHRLQTHQHVDQRLGVGGTAQGGGGRGGGRGGCEKLVQEGC